MTRSSTTAQTSVAPSAAVLGLCVACGATHAPVTFVAPVAPAQVDIGSVVRFDDVDAQVVDDRSATWTIGSLPPIDVAAMRARVPKLRACYAAGLARDANLGGWVDLAVVVDDAGAVASIDTTTCHHDTCSDSADDAPPPDAPFADELVVACMKAAIRDARFHVRHARILVPFELSPTP